MVGEPISAEARGLRRLWKRAAAARFADMDKRFYSNEVRQASRNFRKTNSGKQTSAAIILSRAFKDCCVLDIAGVAKRQRVLIWSTILPAEESPLRDTDERALSMEERQAASAVHYIYAGGRPGLLRGMWAASFTDHAVGRLFHRWRSADADTVIREAHRRILEAPERSVPEMIVTGSFVLPTSNGGFWCRPIIGKSSETQEPVLHFRATTWLHSDMESYDRQMVEARRLLTCLPDDVPLIRSLLHPLHLRGATTKAA